MRSFKRSSALLLLSLLPACSNVGKPPEVTGTAAQICERWPLITPSKSKDRISEPTARQIAETNTANEVWCRKAPAKVAEARQ